MMSKLKKTDRAVDPDSPHPSPVAIILFCCFHLFLWLRGFCPWAGEEQQIVEPVNGPNPRRLFELIFALFYQSVDANDALQDDATDARGGSLEGF